MRMGVAIGGIACGIALSGDDSKAQASGGSPVARCPAAHRRGAVYLAVLGVAMVVTLLGVTGIMAARLANEATRQTANGSQAMICAEAGIDLALYEMESNAGWRSDATLAARLTDRALGKGRFTAVLSDEDGNLTEHSYDPVTITSTGTKGGSTHTMRVIADAKGVPLDLLGRALHTGGELRVRAGGEIEAVGAPISTNGALNNQAFISGQVLCGSVTSAGTVSGGVTAGSPALAWPPAGIFTTYAALGTVINPGASISGNLLTPWNNPWGSPNADGVYIINTSSDLTIKNSRIEGTLIINAPGRTITIETGVSMKGFRPQYPTLMVRGNVLLKSDRTQQLSELLMLTNFNPTGSPYGGVSDIDILDTYPVEIAGLVFVRGMFLAEGKPLIRGALMVESNSNPDSARVDGLLRIEYDYKVQEQPAMEFTSGVKFVPRSGTWKRVVSP